MMGMRATSATRAATCDAPEQLAPMSTLAPRPLHASCVKRNAAANSSRVFGRRSSATPSDLLLISRNAWYTGARRDVGAARVKPAACVRNMGSITPIRISAVSDGCGSSSPGEHVQLYATLPHMHRPPAQVPPPAKQAPSEKEAGHCRTVVHDMRRLPKLPLGALRSVTSLAASKGSCISMAACRPQTPPSQ
eukprot:7388104-Prymnesium_polylepis.1